MSHHDDKTQNRPNTPDKNKNKLNDLAGKPQNQKGQESHEADIRNKNREESANAQPRTADVQRNPNH